MAIDSTLVISERSNPCKWTFFDASTVATINNVAPFKFITVAFLALYSVVKVVITDKDKES